MSIAKTTLVALGLAAMFTISASAQAPSTTPATPAAAAAGTPGTTLEEGHIKYIHPSGRTTTHRVSEKKHAAVMKEGRPLAAGAMIYRKGGKLYLIEDKQMPGGKMLSDERAGWSID